MNKELLEDIHLHLELSSAMGGGKTLGTSLLERAKQALSSQDKELKELMVDKIFQTSDIKLLVAQLEKCEEFIINGSENGYIQIPEAPDNAHYRLKEIQSLIAKHTGKKP